MGCFLIPLHAPTLIVQPQFTSGHPETAKLQIGLTRHGKQFFGCVRANNSRQEGVKAHEVSQGIQRYHPAGYHPLLDRAPHASEFQPRSRAPYKPIWHVRVFFWWM